MGNFVLVRTLLQEYTLYSEDGTVLSVCKIPCDEVKKYDCEKLAVGPTSAQKDDLAFVDAVNANTKRSDAKTVLPGLTEEENSILESTRARPYGRSKVDPKAITILFGRGLKPKEIAKLLSCHESTIYNYTSTRLRSRLKKDPKASESSAALAALQTDPVDGGIGL